jgi:SAM-dependent methyltransferase
MNLFTRTLFLGGRLLHLGSNTLITSAGATLTLAGLRANIRARWETFNDSASAVEDGLYDWETRVADRLARPAASVLIAGCGSGRDVLPYLQRGCRVTGVDPAPRALALARQVIEAHGFSIDLIEGFIDDTVVPGRFDAAVFSWGCYSAIPESRRRINTLKRVASQLNPGGLISLNFERLPRPRAIVIEAARLAGRLAGSDWRLEPGDVVEWRHHGGDPFFAFTHAFKLDEIERETAAAGLRIVERQDPPDFPFYILERVASSREPEGSPAFDTP